MWWRSLGQSQRGGGRAASGPATPVRVTGYIGPVRVETAGTLVRWVLLCALALGVLGMHHLSGLGHGSAAEHAPAAAAVQADTPPLDTVPAHAAPQRHCCPDPTATTPSTPGHDGEHDLLAHLCLAVLVAAFTIGLLILLRRTRRGPAPPAHLAVSGSGYPRPPPPPTSIRLASLCVLRL